MWGGAENILSFGGGVILEGVLHHRIHVLSRRQKTVMELLVAVVSGAFSGREQTLRT